MVIRRTERGGSTFGGAAQAQKIAAASRGRDFATGGEV